MKTYYVYESHLGCDYYVTDHELEDTYCDSCGDSDILVASGTYEDIKEYYKRELVEAQRTYKDIMEGLNRARGSE